MSLEKAIQKTYDWATGEYPWKLTCPVCGFDYLHITALSCLRHADETTITKEGTIVKEAQNDMRGVRITIQYLCENGHAGRITLQFHKGNVYMAHEILPLPKECPADIWRN